MDKVYIPDNKTCCLCSGTGTRASGFKGKPKRWVFCNNCFVKWMGIAQQRGNTCPRETIWKILAGRT